MGVLSEYLYRKMEDSIAESDKLAELRAENHEKRKNQNLFKS